MTECPQCNVPLTERHTHQHSPTHFRSPANPHGPRAGIWHDVTWREDLNKWVCDSRCHGGYGKECHHIKEVLSILRDEFNGWLGEVPRHPSTERKPVVRQVVLTVTPKAEPKPQKRLEDLYPD